MQNNLPNWLRTIRKSVCRQCGLPLDLSDTPGVVRCPTPTCRQITVNEALRRDTERRELEQQDRMEKERLWKESLPRAYFLGERGRKRAWRIEGSPGVWHWQASCSSGLWRPWSVRVATAQTRWPGCVIANGASGPAVFTLLSMELPKRKKAPKPKAPTPEPVVVVEEPDSDPDEWDPNAASDREIAVRLYEQKRMLS